MSKLLRRLGFLGLVGAVALTATACGKKKEEYKYGELKVSIPTGIIRTSLDIIALEKGFFKEEGVKVTGVNIKGMDALTALHTNSNDLDLLTLAFVPDVQAISNGYDNIRFIGGTAVEGGALIAKKGSADTYKDTTTKINFDAIKNAKLGFAVGEAAWVVTNQYLIENDPTYSEGSYKDLDITNLKDEQTVAQLVGNGQIEVGFLPLEYANLYKDAYNVEIITASGDLIPEYVCCRQATSSEKLAAKKDAFLAYEKARIRAWEYIENQKNRDDVVKTIADYIKKEESYVSNYLYGGITKWSVDPNKKGIVTYTAALKNADVLKNEISDIASYVDTSVYEEAINFLKDNNSKNQFYTDKYTLYLEYNK